MRVNFSGLFPPVGGDPTAPLAGVKRAIRRSASVQWFGAFWSLARQNRLPLFNLHRFAEPDFGVYGHDPTVFRLGLERLRQERYRMLSVDEALGHLALHGRFPSRSVVFTMDDGYRGALAASAEILSAYDCPLTVFLTTGFIDGTYWLWWDQLEYVCLHSQRTVLTLDWRGAEFRVELELERIVPTVLYLSEWCKTLPDPDKWEFITRLAEVGEVEIPRSAPAQYAPLSWSEARSYEQRGIRFGPHTVTHPVLPRTSSDAARWEITESWASVRRELERPSPVFAYPNGDYGTREVEMTAAAGMTAAVTTVPDYADGRAICRGTMDAFRIPRFGYPEAAVPLLLTASGFTRLRSSLRRRLRPRRGLRDASTPASHSA